MSSVICARACRVQSDDAEEEEEDDDDDDDEAEAEDEDEVMRSCSSRR